MIYSCALLRYKDVSGKQYAKLVSKTFRQIFEELEGSSCGRKKWMILLKDISEYLACIAKAPPDSAPIAAAN